MSIYLIPTYLQSDQIGQFLQVLGNKLSQKLSPYILDAQMSRVNMLLRNAQVDFLKMTCDCVFRCLISHVNVLLCNAQVDFKNDRPVVAQISHVNLLHLLLCNAQVDF